MSLLLKYCALLSLLLAMPAVAGEGDWSVLRASREGDALERQTWIPVRSGDTIPNNAWISTGSHGRVQPVCGVENIAFQPNTLAGIVTRGTQNRKTDVYQQSGVLDLEIEKRARPHTTVQAPFLAAVVKGTNFRGAIGRSEAKIFINRRLILVSSFASGQRSEVGAWQSATVNSARGMHVSVALTASEQNRVPRGRRYAQQVQAYAGGDPAGEAAGVAVSASTATSGDHRAGHGRRGGWSAARAAVIPGAVDARGNGAGQDA